MKKILFLLIAASLLTNCGSFDYVYETKFAKSDLKNNTQIFINGDRSDIIYNKLVDKIGNSSGNKEYTLFLNSIQTEAPEITSKDATASKFSIEFSIDYTLNSNLLNCDIKKTTINTRSFYNSKSEGFSFGTDLSKKESIEKNLNSNIETFFKELLGGVKNLACIN